MVTKKAEKKKRYIRRYALSRAKLEVKLRELQDALDHCLSRVSFQDATIGELEDQWNATEDALGGLERFRSELLEEV